MSFKMKYSIIPLYLTPTNTKRRSGTKMQNIGFITAHDTGNPKSTARGNVKYYQDSINEKSASAHIFVDDKEIIECVPFLTGTPEKAWHVIYDVPTDNNLFGDDANDIAGGVEYCYGTNINADEAYKRYVWVLAYSFYKHNISPSKLTGHFILDPDRKTDPKSGLAVSGRTFEQLQKDVINEYNACKDADVIPSVNTPSKEVTQVTIPQVVKERIYAEGGVLKRADGNYKVSATDVRYIKFDKNSYKLKLVWAKGKSVSQLVKESGADYGFNFPFFDSGNPLADCKIGSTILGKGYDVANGAQMTKWHGFCYKNGQPSIGMFNINDDLGLDGFLVKTTPLLINNGNACWDYYRNLDGTASDIGKSSTGYVRAQRTFVGIDTQGNLHLAVGDGRTTYDIGLTLEEMSLYMASKGCIQALNGDGGSSSVIADKSGSLGQNVGANERAVNHAVLVFINPPVVAPTPTPTPIPPSPIPQPVPQGGTTMEQWKKDMGLAALQALQAYKLPNSEPIIDLNTWKDKLDQPVEVWFFVEMLKRVLQAK